MIDYETYCKIVQLHHNRLRVSQIARTLALDERTVAYWIEEGAYRPRKTSPRPSKLDAYKPQILRWLELFYRRFFSQQFKRSAMPDGPKVGSVALSPRGDWRMPSDASAAVWLGELAAVAEQIGVG